MKASEPHQPELRVLVLDDEAPIRKLAQTALERINCSVSTAENGREGLRVILNGVFDVVVADIRMEEMDGLAFIQEALKIWPWLGVVVMTGYADRETVERARALGVTRILDKPFTVKALQQAVREEVSEKKVSNRMLPPQSFEQLQYQFGVLRQMSDIALSGESLLQSLKSISDGLSVLLPCDAFAVLGAEEEDRALTLTLRTQVGPSFIEGIKQEIHNRYEALSGKRFDWDELHMQMEGPSPVVDDTNGSPGSLFSVPIISGNEVHGLLTMASLQAEAYDSSSIAFLYHAANQFSTVLGAMKQVHSLAVRDPLTGLYNRRQLNDELKQAWELSRRYDQPLSLAIIDIDNFKPLNDRFGHLVGDQILREFSAMIVNVSRASDIVGRFGGDEFMVVLPQTRPAEARSFGDRLLDACRRTTFLAKTESLRLTPSIGLSSTLGELVPETPEDLLNRADQALYHSKHKGRARATLWQPSLKTSPRSPSEEPPSETAEAKTSLGRVLIVDDEASVCRLISRMLERENYEADATSTAREALKIIRKHPARYDVVLVDLQLSEESGLDFLEQVREINADLVRIVITGHATVDNAVASIRHGAYDFIEKPVVREHLTAVLNRAVQFRRLTMENMRYQIYLEDMVRQKSAALVEALDETKNAYNFTLEAMVRLLDAREKTTGPHSMRVRDLVVLMAKVMRLQGEELDMISHGAILHDIGKIAVPDSILLKPGPLDDREWEIMRMHPQIGYDILKSIPYLEPAAEIVLSHHERFDGGGYPRGLQGEAICLGARLFAVADAYDAMRSPRVYHASMSVEQAVEEIRQGSGSQFDPKVVSCMLSLVDSFERIGTWPEAGSAVS